MLTTYNKQIAVEPFKEMGVEAKVQNGFASIKQKSTLKRLKVLIGNEKIKAGSYVYVMNELYRQPWAVKVYTMGSQDEFILMPEDHVLIVEESNTRDV